MSLGERARDWLVTGGFLGVIAILVGVGWFGREGRAYAPVTRGEAAPAFVLDRIDGGTLSLAELRGKVVMLNLWATWCPPCRVEMPSMQRVYEEYRDRGFEVVAVAVDDQPGLRQPDGTVRGLVSEFVERFGLTFPVVVDPTGATERLYGVEALPTTFLIDRTGRIRVREVGGRFWDREPQLEMIRKLLEE
ncbi:MAG TPA: TlpA disulfide reductase family protein [Longimicrobiales bacterium]|nr:TlpA disulfide reductase family protein [Longimicrobiales bacterium]